MFVLLGRASKNVDSKVDAAWRRDPRLTAHLPVWSITTGSGGNPPLHTP